MRIVAGTLGGRRLLAPKDRAVRPTSDKLRGTLFNILAHGDHPPLKSARVADLFAGTGALGLEALSRGAIEVVFVENAGSSVALLNDNIAALGLKDRTRIIKGDATRLPNAEAAFDLLFLDPPYHKGLADLALRDLMEKNWLAPDGTIIVETAANENLTLPKALRLKSDRRAGTSRLWFIGIDGD